MAWDDARLGADIIDQLEASGADFGTGRADAIDRMNAMALAIATEGNLNSGAPGPDYGTVPTIASNPWGTSDAASGTTRTILDTPRGWLFSVLGTGAYRLDSELATASWCQVWIAGVVAGSPVDNTGYGITLGRADNKRLSCQCVVSGNLSVLRVVYWTDKNSAASAPHASVEVMTGAIGFWLRGGRCDSAGVRDASGGYVTFQCSITGGTNAAEWTEIYPPTAVATAFGDAGDVTLSGPSVVTHTKRIQLLVMSVN